MSPKRKKRDRASRQRSDRGPAGGHRVDRGGDAPPPSGRKRSLRDVLASDPFSVVLLAAFALFFFAAIIKVDEVFYGSDLFLSFYFYTDFTYQMLRALTFPFGNPFIFSGTPYFPSANGLYYPIHYLFVALPTPLAMNLNLILHFFLAGAFTYGFLRHLGQTQKPALVGALIFMFPVLEILHLYGGHIPRLEARVWIPFLFWMLHGFYVTRRFRYFALGALGIAFASATGHLQIVFYTLFSLALYAVFLLLNTKEKSILRNTGRIAAFVAAGIGVAAVQLLPIIHWSSTAGRAESFEFATSFSFPPLSLATALVPFIFGDRVGGLYFGPSFLWEACLFIGLPALLLIGSALALKRDRQTAFFFGMLALTLIVALGKHTPVYKLFYYGVPGYRFFRVPGRILTVFVFFAAVLASFGAGAFVERLGDRSKGTRWLYAAPAGVLGLLLTGLLLLAFTDPGGNLFRELMAYLVVGMTRVPDNITTAAATLALKAHGFMLAQVGVAAGFAAAATALLVLGRRRILSGSIVLAALVVLIFAEQYTHAERYLSTIPESKFDWEAPIEAHIREQRLAYDDAPEKGLFRVIDSRSTGNLDKGIRYGVSSLGGYEGGILKRYNEFVNVARGKPKDRYYAVLKFRRYHPMLDLLNVKYIFDYGRPAIRSDLFRAVYRDRQLTISERTNPVPRAWVVHEAVIETDGDAVLDQLYRRTRDIRRTAILEDQEAKTISPEHAHAYRDKVTITGYGPNRIRLDAKLEREGYLVLSEIDYPGWEATVDGRPAKVQRADYLLRALYLDKGRHRVELCFTPPWFLAGAMVSLATLLLLLGFGILKARRRRTATGPS